MNRKKFLKYTGLAGLVVATGGTGVLLTSCGDSSTGQVPTALATAQTSTSTASLGAFDPANLNNFNTPLNLPGNQGALGILEVSDKPIEMSALPASLELIKGKKTDLLVYQVSQGGKTLVNPILKIKQGADFSTVLTNSLKEDTNLHWHGLHLPWKMDGHPSLPVKSGSDYRYQFKIQNRGGTYWYHPHPDKLTARQAYWGLASFFIVEDDDNTTLNQALDLKFGESDLPIVIQDKAVDGNGKLVYQPDLMAQTMGFLGDVIMANLTINPYLDVSTRIYRFRLLNGSNSRIYRLALVKSKNSEKIPYSIIGTDGGLLDRPYPVTEVFLSPGERVDILVDLTKSEVGEVISLKSLPFDPMENEGGMMGGMTSSNTQGTATSATGADMSNMGNMPGMNHGSATPAASNTGSLQTPTNKLANGQEFHILKLVVKSKANYTKVIPTTLSSITPLNLAGANIRPLTLSQVMSMSGSNMQMQWLINGKAFKMDEYPVTVKKDSLEVWEFRNETQSMPHPMHLHGFQFQVVERTGSPAQLKQLAVHSQGRLPTDLGWKDTVLVWPGEVVKIAVDFRHNFEGEQLFVAHCHNLEHEDQGMMLNYKIV